MLMNYLKVSLAQLMKNKLYSLINIMGLAIGLAVCVMIAVLIRYELNFDDFFKDAERIYRLSPDFQASSIGPERHPAPNVAALAALVKSNPVSGIENIARVGRQRVLVASDDIAFSEGGFRWADHAFFKIFEFTWLQGGPDQALTEPFSAVINASTAAKYFSDQEAIGQILMLENEWPVTVIGVIEDIPVNSHLSGDIFVSMDTAWALLGFNYEQNWAYTNFYTYVKLEDGAHIDNVLAGIDALIANNVGEAVAGFFNLNGGGLSFTPYRLQDIHLFSNRDGELGRPGSLSFVLTFSAIAVCLLLIACINFVNLSTARSSRRGKEVGLRKALGASRRELMVQFLGESLVMVLTASLLALMLCELLLPGFAALMERPLEMNFWRQPGFMLLLFLGVTVTVLLAGGYPAIYLSAFNPVKALKPDGHGGISQARLRNGLVIIQFTLAIVLVIATIVVTMQLRFARSMELGFSRENILVIRGTFNDGLGPQWQSLKQRLEQHKAISAVTEGYMSPGQAENRQVRLEEGVPEGRVMLGKRVGEDFMTTYGIEILAGRGFDAERSTDYFTHPANLAEKEQGTGSFIISAMAAAESGWTPEQAIGKKFEMDFSNDFSVIVAGNIIGVVEDIYFDALSSEIQPMFYYMPSSMWGGLPSFDVASVRMKAQGLAEGLAYIEEQWQAFNPDLPLLYHFLETEYLALYRDEEREGRLFVCFAVLTVCIACLGLYGLSTFAAERRKKEIGVRKVMGGSVTNIALLMTGDFIRLVLLSNLFAWPLAYWGMNRWLESFAYRIELTPLIFVVSGLTALLIAWLTVGGTAMKAASQKPVAALRYE